MIHLLLFIASFESTDYIDHVINNPVSVVLTLIPLEKMVLLNSKNKILVMNLEGYKRADINDAYGFGYIRKKHKHYIIEFNEKYLMVNDESVEVTHQEMNATRFTINHSRIGYSIEYDGRCVTKKTEDGRLQLMPCEKENGPMFNLQRFDFISLDRSFYTKINDMVTDLPINSTDYEDLNDSDYNLQRKFKESIFDNNFTRSMKYFYDYAACEAEEANKTDGQKIEGKNCDNEE